jgi:transcriptional regulator with XRE-family HTH domain
MFLHEQLRVARMRAGWTQSELAARVGIPRNQIVRAEKGENITIDTLRKIAAHLPVDNLTLLEKVKLNVDVFPEPERVYYSAMGTLTHLHQAMTSALDLAMSARVALMSARRKEPLPYSVGEGEVDDLFLLKSAENLYRELADKLEALRSA